MIKLRKGLPFEDKIPNAETLKTMEDARLWRKLEELDMLMLLKKKEPEKNA